MSVKTQMCSSPFGRVMWSTTWLCSTPGSYIFLLNPSSPCWSRICVCPISCGRKDLESLEPGRLERIFQFRKQGVGWLTHIAHRVYWVTTLNFFFIVLFINKLSIIIARKERVENTKLFFPLLPLLSLTATTESEKFSLSVFEGEKWLIYLFSYLIFFPKYLLWKFAESDRQCSGNEINAFLAKKQTQLEVSFLPMYF